MYHQIGFHPVDHLSGYHRLMSLSRVTRFRVRIKEVLPLEWMIQKDGRVAEDLNCESLKGSSKSQISNTLRSTLQPRHLSTSEQKCKPSPASSTVLSGPYSGGPRGPTASNIDGRGGYQDCDPRCGFRSSVCFQKACGFT